MAFGTCCSGFKTLSRAAAKYTAAVVRRAGGLAVHPDWVARATACERCPVRVLVGRVSYCGRPYQSQPERDPEEGCGCPTRDKARDPDEHCPLNAAHRPASRPDGAACDCKWCARSGV